VARGRQRHQGLVVIALEASIEHGPISSSPTSVRKLEEEVAQDHGLNGAPAKTFLSTYVTALEKEMALSRGGMEKDDRGGEAGL
jgi:hypothetical protein